MNITKQHAIIITGYTGILACDFSDFHEDVEKRLGRPVYTHEFVALKADIKELYEKDFSDLCRQIGKSVKEGGWHALY